MNELNQLIEAFYGKTREINYDVHKRLLCADGQNEVTKLQAERLDRLRHALEPYVYNYLEFKYGKQLSDFWINHEFPKESDYAWVIVERRCHPNWSFILRNIAWAGPHMSLYIFCSNENIEFLKSVLGEKAKNVHLIPAFEGFTDRKEGIHQMNSLMTHPLFYKVVRAKYMLTFQMDTFFRKKIIDDIFVGDFYGAPWGWSPNDPGGGGITIRNIERMIELCSKEVIPDCPGDGYPEDGWIGDLIKKYGGSYPPLEFRINIFCENMSVSDPSGPFGVHQFWTFLDNFKLGDREEFTKNLEALLTFDIQ